MSEKLWVRSQNAYSEAFWTSSTDRVPRIRTLRDRISRVHPQFCPHFKPENGLRL